MPVDEANGGSEARRSGAAVPRMISTPVILHERDFRAFLVGMQRYYPSPYWFTASIEGWKGKWHAKTGCIVNCASIEPVLAMMQDRMPAGGPLVMIYFEPPQVDPVTGKRTLPGGDNVLRAYFTLPGYYRPLEKRGDLWKRLDDTRISAVYFKEDDRKRLFSGRVARALKRVTTTEVDFRNRDCGAPQHTWREFGKINVGLAALAWAAADPRNRTLEYDAVPKPSWTFPNDHPWYQDEP